MPDKPILTTTRLAAFCWTGKGKRVHITDDGLLTRCGWAVTADADADDVMWWWPPCGKCARDE